MSVRHIRVASRVTALLTLGVGITQAQPGFPPNEPDSWVTAATAKVYCSSLFVSGRDPEEARRHLNNYFLGPKIDSISHIEVDLGNRIVSVTLAQRLTRRAKYFGDQGCIILQPGKDSIYFTPVKASTALPPAETMDWPMGDRLPRTPLPAEVDTVKLRQAVDAAFANPQGLTAAFVVVHKGRLIAERYAQGAHKDMPLESWSMGKSITGTLIGRLLNDGAFKLEDPAPVPEWRKTPNDPRAKIRIMDLMRMSSGLRFSRGSPEDSAGYHDHDLIYSGAIDAFQFSLSRPRQFEPNTFGRYRNVDPLTLGYIIRETVRKRGEEYLTYPRRALFDKLGMRNQVLETDPYGNFLLTGYDYGTARNWARLGMLYVQDGMWMGERLLPAGFVQFVSTPAPGWRTPTYGGMVWVNGDGGWPLPKSAFAFRGVGGQDTYIVPTHDLVVVRMGHFPGARFAAADMRRALTLLMEAIPARN
ncbi:MAG: serine hydrolase [Gemmatimonadota bacterium]